MRLKPISAGRAMTRLLIVDDSALMRKLLGRIFSAEPEFEIQFARNGIEALELLKSFLPDVITLDIHMPQMDGLSCLDRIMVERPCAVVMLSSLTAEGADETMRAFELGAVDFVAKPTGAVTVRVDEFVPELLEKVRSAAGAKFSSATRLKDRVRHNMARGTVSQRRAARKSVLPVEAAPGAEGLVLVGTSTGGPPALEELLTRLPANFPWPIVIAQHMPPTFTGALARRLDQLCAIGVREVTEPKLLEPGCAYVGNGGGDVVVSRKAAGLMAAPAAPSPEYLWRPSVDRLVRSAMDCVAPARLIGVQMTGMGNDGAEAMALLHTRGGRVIAESERTAIVWGMPGELVKLGGADWILPLPDIATKLNALAPTDAADTQDS